LAKFRHFERVKVEKVNEQSQQLDPDKLGRLRDGMIALCQKLLLSHRIVNRDGRLQHVINLLSVSLAFKIREEGLFEKLNRHEAFLVVDHLIELVAKVVQDAIVHVEPVNLLDDPHPVLWVVWAFCETLGAESHHF
jgi:hypothetical protein